MDNLDFSEEEIQEQLAILGYKNIPKHRLREFKQDLDELIRHGEWKTLTSPTHVNSTRTHPATSQPSPPAYTKEKVGQCSLNGSGEGFFLHAAKSDHERQVLTTCQNRDFGRQQVRYDSYAQHSVAAKLQLPPGAPTRLQVESDPEDTLHPPLTDSYTSSPDTQGRHFIKRKVLRKHKGQSLVCDESIYSEDSAGSLHRSHTSARAQVATMYKTYKTQWDDDDKDSLSSSFWSDGEKQEEEEEEVVVERVVKEEDSKPAEDPLQDASKEEKPELLNNQGGFTRESSEDGSNNDDEEEEEREEEDEEEEREVNEEDSKLVAEGEDSFQETSEEEEKPELDNQGSFSGESSEDGSNDEEEEEGEEEEEEEEDDEEEEQIEIERVVNEEDSTPVAEAEDSLQEASEEEKPELNNHSDFREESSEDGSDDDDEEEEEEEEEVDDIEIERVVNEEDSKAVAEAEDSLQTVSEEKPELLNNQGNFPRESSEDKSKDDEEEEEEDGEEEEERSSSSSSPAPSLMTSGYGTYRPEELEGGDYRDNHTITEFDQDSRGDLSETRDDEEDDRSLNSFAWFDIESTQEAGCSETRPGSVSEDSRPEDTRRGHDTPHEDTGMKPEEDEDGADEEKSEEVTDEGSEERRRRHVAEEREHDERPEEQKEKEEDNVEEEAEDEASESGDPHESSSNEGIKFIDSKVDFNPSMYEWEGNLRQKKDAASCLEERLEELHLSTSAQHDYETENEDGSGPSDSHSSESDGISPSAFESYIRSMTRTQSEGDLRPKPKSFIRPVMSQQTIKKTDPVARYFQYKQLWEMFKLPGEKDRRALRWEIKERLAYQPPPPKPRRVYVPNTYIVPTEKKRSALRWEIRNDLANGLLPHKFNYRF